MSVPRRLTKSICVVAVTWAVVAAHSTWCTASDPQAEESTTVEEFRPVTDQQVEQARQNVVAAAAGLERFLAHGRAENAVAWKRYLRWDDLQQVTSADGEPDPRLLGEVLAQQYTGEPGLELPPFVALRDALLRYRRLQLAVNDENVAALYREQLAAVEKDLESGIKTSGGPLADLTARLEWLEQLGQAPKYVAEIRQQFAQPNLLVSASAETINRGFNEPVAETTAVSEMILKTHVTGTAHTVGNLTARLLPMNDQAAIELTLSGVATSQTVGRQSPVRIYSQGVTQVLARKRLLIDSLGVRSDPATAYCSTQNHICRIRSDSAFASGLIEKVAWKKARQQEPIAECISARRAEHRLAARMDQQTQERTATSNSRWEQKLRRPLRGRGIYPRQMSFWSTPERLHMAAWQGGSTQLAAPSSPVNGPPDHVVAHLHESMIHNTAFNAIGGLTVTDERAQEMVKEMTGEVPEELQIRQDEDPWSITFDVQQPLSIKFDNDRVVIAIRGRRFVRGDQEVRQVTEISATYRVDIRDGRALLTREGDVEVTYPEKTEDRLSLTELRNKTFLTGKFGAVFKQELSGKGLQLSDRWKNLGAMSLQHLTARDGWLTMGWN